MERTAIDTLISAINKEFEVKGNNFDTYLHWLLQQRMSSDMISLCSITDLLENSERYLMRLL